MMRSFGKRAKITPLLTLVVLLWTGAVHAETTDFALVVTNNRSLDDGRADLRYADDDGAKWAGLFREWIPAPNVQLLTRFDASSKRLYPQFATQALPPTRKVLLEAVEKIRTAVKKAKAAGQRTRVYVVLAGHGDVERGKGFVELEDQRFSALDLDQHGQLGGLTDNESTVGGVLAGHDLGEVRVGLANRLVE